jgi:hypothetical protein
MVKLVLKKGEVMNNEIPEWAWRRAAQLFAKECKVHETMNRFYPSCKALARYIAEHEQPPREKLYDLSTAVFKQLGLDYDKRSINELTEALRSLLPNQALEYIENME